MDNVVSRPGRTRRSTTSSEIRRSKTGIDTDPYADTQSSPQRHDELSHSNQYRDSHDLSLMLTSNRNSVVDHMLLSLGSLPNGSSAPALAIYGTRTPETQKDPYTSTKGRRRGHTHSASRTSDQSPVLDTNFFSASSPRNASSTSEDVFRDRRKNSQELRTKIPPLSTTADATMQSRYSHGISADGMRFPSDVLKQSSPLGARAMRAGSRSNGVDLASKQPSQSAAASVLNRGRPVPGGYWHTDAAPEPHIPAGPLNKQMSLNSLRHTNNTGNPPMPTYEPPDAPKSTGRRSSIKSASGRFSRLKKPDNTIGRSQPDTVYHTGGSAGHDSDLADPLAAPSPSAGYHKSIVSPAEAPDSSISKEKGGFFRRVFGSSKPTFSPTSSQTSSQRDSRPPTQGRKHSNTPMYPPENPSDRDRPRTQPAPRTQSTPDLHSQHSFSQLKLQGIDQAPEVPPVPAEHLPQQTLNKKPSSFFRRRRKQSTSDSSRPPVTFLKQHPKSNKDERTPGQSNPSISSLREVMNPYLDNETPVAPADPTSPRHNTAAYGVDERRDLASDAERLGQDLPTKLATGFSPDYTPHKDSAIRTVPPGSPQLKDENAASGLHQQQQLGTKFKVKVNKSRSAASATPTSPTFGDQLGEQRETSPVTSSNAASSETSQIRRLQSPSHPIEGSPPMVQGSAKFANDDWLMAGLDSSQPKLDTNGATHGSRVWLDDDLDEQLSAGRGSPKPGPLESPKVQSEPRAVSPLEALSPAETEDVFLSATSLPIVQVEGDEVTDLDPSEPIRKPGSVSDVDELKTAAAASVAIDSENPTEEDCARAADIFAGSESFVRKDRAAGWLGETSFKSARTRKAFMDLFDWTGLSILVAFRELCEKLILRAESQQLDRLIDAFSKRWCACNSQHGFKTYDVVHTIAFSVLMLNTDLHLADMDSKMTRNEFIKNTLPTLRRIADESAPPQNDVPKDEKSGAATPVDRAQESEQDNQRTGLRSPTEPSRPSLELKRGKNRLSLLPPGVDFGFSSDSATNDNCNVLVNRPHEGTMKTWESQVEIVLREFYNNIRHLPLPLHGNQPQSNSLGVSGLVGGLRRSPSVMSKTPSETTTSYRGRGADPRAQTSRWPTANKGRSRTRLYPNSTIGSSRTSLDDQSVWSPSASSTYSKFSRSVHGGTNSSSWNVAGTSVESLGSGLPNNDDGYKQSIGFANALSQAIIREEHAAQGASGSEEEFGKVRPLLDDETLELHGAPWAKEGMVKHKHHLDSTDKKAKDRNWSECFAVVEQGYLRLFSFTQNSKSLRNKTKGSTRSNTGNIVGGGNWHSQAESLGSFLLRQTIASTLPPPGYSKQRPHVWALSLPTGAVHLFQVGTDDICSEFVKTANYWSARLSKEPLIGGVSNIEYGWSDNIINMALVEQQRSESRQTSISAASSARHIRRPSTSTSFHGSLRGGSIDRGHSSTDRGAGGSIRARLPGDKTMISEWSRPVQSMMASQLMEVDQLRALTAYVKAVEDELDRHNGLRQAVGLAFSPRHPNALKAQANWERKSAYLLQEIVKFKTYVSSLTDANRLRDKVYAERQLRDSDNRVAAGAAGDAGAANGGRECSDDLAPETAEAVRRAQLDDFSD